MVQTTEQSLRLKYAPRNTPQASSAGLPPVSSTCGREKRPFVAKLGRVAVNKPSNSDLYTVEMAEFVDTFRRLAQPQAMPHLFIIEGGALGVENALKTAMDWKVRKNLGRGRGEKGHQVVHFRECFHGRTGYTISCTNTDPVKSKYFAKFDWPRITNPDDPAHLVLDITPALAVKTQAALCHRSQHALFVRRRSQAAGRQLSVPEVILRLESLHRVLPPANGQVEDDLAKLLKPYEVK